MKVLECKTCGGRVLPVSDVLGECESCGRSVTLPRVQDDVRIEFYNRANYFRNNGEFDRAYSDFEHIIAQDGTDAEAYWSLVMCKYGVIYQKDPKTGSYSMLVSTVRQEPIWEDVDYLSAIRNCDETAKPLYRADARQIDEFAEDYFALSRSETAYDVFLCVKHADHEGCATEAAKIAKTVCDRLREKHLRVYCPWEQPEGTHAVFALNTAKLMFTVATTSNELNDPHIRALWRLFQGKAETDRSRHLVPVYSGMDKYALPEEIPTHEAICADNPGWWQDLTWGALQLLGKQKAPVEAEEEGIGAEDFVKEAKKSFEARNLSAAGLMAEQALNYDPNNAYAHFYLLMAKYKAHKLEDLFAVAENWETNTALNRIIALDKGELSQKLTAFRKEYCNRRDFSLAKNHMSKEEFAQAIPLLEKICGYSDSEKVLTECRKLYHHQTMLRKYRQETQNDSAGHLFRTVKEKHADVMEMLERKLNRVYSAPRAKHSHIGALVCGILMAVIGLFLWVVEAANWEAMYGFDSFAGVFYFLVAAAYGFGVLDSKFKGAVFGFIGFLFMSTFITEPYDGVENIALSVFPFITFLINFMKESKYKKLLDDLNTYEKTVVAPVEQKIVAEIKARYGEVLTEAEIGTFNSVRSVTEQDVKIQRGVAV